VVRPSKISQIKSTVTNLAQTSHFAVNFGGFSGALRTHLLSRGIGPIFTGESLTLLCNSASLPASSFATADIVGNYMGVAEKMAHTRQFTQIDLEFYVDREYKVVKFLEHWMEFIASGSYQNPANDGYFYRMQYPSLYKTSQTNIIKFERDYNNSKTLQYSFFGLFPISMNSIPVNYSSSEIMKASATFNFDRYVCGQTSSLSFFLGVANNLQNVINNPFPINVFKSSNDPVIYKTGQSLGNQSGVTPVKYTPGNVNPIIQ
jgi:hypothetical protein